MTLGEKRRLVSCFCGEQSCVDTCPLYVEGFEKPLFKTEKLCLCIGDASEADLDRALKLIEEYEHKSAPIEDADIVNKAPHYNAGGIECIKAIEASMSAEEYRGFLKGQVIKYVWRYEHKGKPVEDLKKARYYLDRLIEKKEDDARD